MEYDSLRIRDILVPVDGSMASLDALALGCFLSKKNKGTVYAVYVIEVARNLPLDAEIGNESNRGEEILTQAEAVAESLDCKLSGELLQARDWGHAVVDEAIEREVNAIVMGVDHALAVGEHRLGEVAQYVVNHAPCQVILCREAVRE